MRGWGRPLGQLLRAAAWKTPDVEEERSGDREPRARGYRAGTRRARHGGPAARRRLPPAPRLPSLPLTSQPFVSSRPFAASAPRPAAPPPPAIASGSGGQGRPQSAPRRGQVRGRWPGGDRKCPPRGGGRGLPQGRPPRGAGAGGWQRCEGGSGCPEEVCAL